ncbi:MAG: GIY-YIG nuclease family protein [candidate division WOR-3 bacterium]|nr:GIY-YIG nuclease family protein [candidate division WOR-3 bacterium]
MKYFVYILQCADDTLYTGVTKDVKKRIDRHNRGDGARYTRGRVPVTLVYHEELANIKSALARERYLRKLPRTKKKKLIINFQNKYL